jgi:hypothetical protein
MKRAQLPALSLALVLVSGEALAIIGMPLTPMSYAGVARRTTRRAAYAGAAYSGAAYAGAAYAGAATAAAISTLPAGCTEVVSAGAVYQRCGTTYYRPAYDGPNLVYVPSAP